ncbi:hypothetical protein [Flammeovirga sp. SJP92]|uniref:hypothetical protein n=1 Tax=Flammeovirga sp. SJP92 TaxID=1775430 RepID=UPI000787F557|nr:hypothetical protein [Flammeovirga sp. SJP92]KXX66926.1 hypothetical protein AVL50_29680 [Flammeovirga sp. SJP92]
MNHFIITLLGLFFTVNVIAQESESLIVSRIDSITYDIDNNSDNLGLHEDGELSKKRFLFFKKKIGGYFSNVVYKDTLVLSIENEYYYKKNGRTENEIFYFSENKLIKYSEETYTDKNLNHKVEIYYKDHKLIKVNKDIHDSFKLDAEKKESIIEKSKNEISRRQMTAIEWKRIFGKK